MRSPSPGRCPQAGFTLIEFTIASALTMVILAATFTLLNMAFKVNATIGEVMATQQNVRVAMNTIARDITMAGTGLPNGGILVPTGTNSDLLKRPGLVDTLATDDNILPVLSPGDSSGPTIVGGSRTNVAAGGTATDAITIVSIDQDSPTWNVATVNAAGTRVTFAQDIRPAGINNMTVNTVLVLTNINGGAFGVVTFVATGSSQGYFDDNDSLNLNQPTAASGNIKDLLNGDGTLPPTTAKRVNLISYYMNNSVTAHPRLMRSVNAQPPQVTVEDIDNLQFSYDLYDYDTSTTNSNQATTTSPNQIRSVNIALGGRSPSILASTRQYYRFAMVSKVNIRNATFRNRYEGT